MLRISAAAIAAVVAVMLTGTLVNPQNSFAHEHRAVGNYEFVVGWLNEPALAYEPNGLDFRVTFFPNGVPSEEEEGTAAEEEGQPVEGLEETLQAEIIAGGGAATRELTLEPAFGEEGAYESVLIPTVPGDYTFRIFGEIEGQQIDESFTSGPETFSVIEDTAELQFPEQLPTNADLQASIDDLSAQIADLDSGGSESDTAMILAIVGIIAGVIGIGVGGFALAQRRS
jgi:hypothetical protein